MVVLRDIQDIFIYTFKMYTYDLDLHLSTAYLASLLGSALKGIFTVGI